MSSSPLTFPKTASLILSVYWKSYLYPTGVESFTVTLQVAVFFPSSVVTVMTAEPAEMPVTVP